MHICLIQIISIKMKTVYLVLLYVLISTCAISQQRSFEITMDVSYLDRVAGVVEDNNGDFIAATTTFLGANYDITLVKFSSLGVVIDSKRIGTADAEFAKSICRTSDGGFFITGYAYSTSTDNDALAIKVDSNFTVQFFKRYGIVGENDYANEGFEALPGNYTFTGTIAIGGSAKPAMVVLNSVGNVIRESYLNTNQFASPDYRGTYLGDGTVGYAHLANAISILDTFGNIIKNINYGFGYSSAIIKSSDGQLAAIGTTVVGGPQGSSLAFCKGNLATGLLSYTQKYSVIGSNFLSVGIVQDLDNNYYLGGNLQSFGSGFSNPVVIKIDSIGNIIWVNQYTPSVANDCQLHSIILTSDEGILISGSSLSGGNTDLFFAKIDSLGSSTCNTIPLVVTQATFVPVSANPHTVNGGALGSIGVTTITDTVVAVSPNILCITTNTSSIDFDNEQIFVYPTVASSYLIFSNQDHVQRMHVIISDVFGRGIFYKKTISSDEKIEIGNLNSGIYLVNITNTETGKTLNQKIVIVKE